MAKPEVPGKPSEKKARKPRGEKRALRLTDEQMARCQEIAQKHASFGITPPALAVAAAALAKGLEVLGE